MQKEKLSYCEAARTAFVVQESAHGVSEYRNNKSSALRQGLGLCVPNAAILFLFVIVRHKKELLQSAAALSFYPAVNLTSLAFCR